MHCLCMQVPFTRTRRRLSIWSFFSSFASTVCSLPAVAQSTFGSFVGAITDPQGAVIMGASVKLYHLGMSGVRETTTGPDGQYSLLNVEAGSYRLVVEFSGFQKLELTGLTLQARETQRVDGVLRLGQQSESVSVEAAAAVNTDTSNLSETRTGIELNTLPLAVSSRAGGSTSPYSTLTSQAGVQTDSAGNISVAGAKPSLLSVTVDGISTMNVRSQHSRRLSSFRLSTRLKRFVSVRTQMLRSLEASAILRRSRAAERIAATEECSITTRQRASTPKILLQQKKPEVGDERFWNLLRRAGRCSAPV